MGQVKALTCKRKSGTGLIIESEEELCAVSSSISDPEWGE